MRAWPGVLALALLAPLAASQTVVNPVFGDYADNYLVMGRVIDASGEPASGARVVVTISQAGVRAEEVTGAANCKGDFIVPFQGFASVSARGRARVTVTGPEGQPDHATEHPLEPFWRRTDAKIQLPYAWRYDCADPREPPFSHTMTVTGRLLNRTEPYERRGASYEALAYEGPLALRWLEPGGAISCPTTQDGRCETVYSDARGDFRYSFLFQEPVVAGGTVQVAAAGGRLLNATVDPLYRVAVFHEELTGAGAPSDEDGIGGPSLALLLAAGAAAALALRRRSA